MEGLAGPLEGIAAGERRQQIALDGKLLFERRQRALRLRQRRLLSNDVGLRDGAKGILPFQNFKAFTENLDDVLGRLDLPADRGFLDRRDDHIGRQREMRGFELPLALLGLRLRHSTERAIPPQMSGV